MTTKREFFQRLEPFHAPSTLLTIQWAYMAAKAAHKWQKRKEKDAEGNPVRYFEHLKRVALILINEVKVVRPEMVISALLHDGFEDTRDLTPEMVEQAFGPDVVTIVKTLSKTPKDGYEERFYMSTDWRPYVIKACDRLDNLRSLSYASPDFQAKQIEETRNKYYPLFDRMVTLTPPEYRPQAQALRDVVIKTTEGHRIEEDGVDRLIRWRDECALDWDGEELIFHILHILKRMIIQEAPEEHREALMEFQSLGEKKQYLRIKRLVG